MSTINVTITLKDGLDNRQVDAILPSLITHIARFNPRIVREIEVETTRTIRP